MNKKNNQDILSIKFVFCKPVSESHYAYSINTTDKTHRTTKDHMKYLLINIDRSLSKKFIKMIDRFDTFIYNVEEKSLTVLDVLENVEITDKQNNKIRNAKKNGKFLTKAEKFSTFYNKHYK
jgi:hypothetical protein